MFTASVRSFAPTLRLITLNRRFTSPRVKPLNAFVVSIARANEIHAYTVALNSHHLDNMLAATISETEHLTRLNYLSNIFS